MKVLVAVDGSPGSDACLAAVLNRTWIQDKIHVVSVYASGLHRLTANTLSQVRASEAVSNASDRLSRQLAGVEVSSAILEGDAVHTLVKVAQEWQADMLFVGAHSDSPKPTVGSLTSELLKVIRCSITVVKTGNQKQHKEQTEHTEENRFVICVDAMAADLGVMKYSHLWPCPAQFLLLSIIPPPIERGSENPKRDAEMFLDGLNRHHQQMSELTEHLKVYLRGLLPSSTVESKIVEALEIGETIMAIANQWQADVIVMSPHEHRGWDKFLVGSVSQEVARHAHCSIELIR